MSESTRRIPVACFAPPFSDGCLARYRELLGEVADPEVRDAYRGLLECVEAWWGLPESKRTDGRKWLIGRRAGGGMKTVEYAEVPLEEDHVKALWELVPWMRELDTLTDSEATGLFDDLPPGELRDAAFHLVWACKELTLDREPMTMDKLPIAG